MQRKTLLQFNCLVASLLWLFCSWSALWAKPVAATKTPGFNDIVKLIERHYGVKHRGFSFVERAGIKVGRKMAGALASDAKRYLELGSIKFAIFENQNFSRPSTASRQSFGQMMNAALAPDWQPLVEVRSGQDADQTYVFLHDAGKVFKVLVVNFSGSDGVVVQANLRMDKLADLIRHPDEAAKSITDEATVENSPE